ncbi:MAG: hypothetical protein GDA46_05110 [Bdellovibrionales bacterium]|nr:hypothetical protein [Bdellovibrionales bacterium]
MLYKNIKTFLFLSLFFLGPLSLKALGDKKLQKALENKKVQKTLESHLSKRQKTLEEVEDKKEPEKEVLQSSQEASINKVRRTKKKMNISAYIAAGTTAFLTTKAAICFSQCPKGCCPQGPMYATLASMAAMQTAKMFDQRDKLNNTCQDISSDGICNSFFDKSNELVEVAPNPLPPGCELNPDLCNPATYREKIVCLPGDVNCDDSNTKKSYINNSEDIVKKLAEKAKAPEGGWDKIGGNPFLKKEFDYDNLAPEQREKLANKLASGMSGGMKDFNQRKQDYMNSSGLFDEPENDKKGKKLAGSGKNLDYDEEDLSSQYFPSSGKENSIQSLTGFDGKNKKGRKAMNSADKLKEMFRKLSSSDPDSSDLESSALSKMSVSIGNDNVGVREDNIFLMVHRMNRKLDERDNRFIRDF